MRRMQILFDDSSVLAIRRDDFFHSIGCDLSSGFFSRRSMQFGIFLLFKIVSEIAFVFDRNCI